jgi:hypothetical protein
MQYFLSDNGEAHIITALPSRNLARDASVRVTDREYVIAHHWGRAGGDGLLGYSLTTISRLNGRSRTQSVLLLSNEEPSGWSRFSQMPHAERVRFVEDRMAHFWPILPELEPTVENAAQGAGSNRSQYAYTCERFERRNL